MKTTAYWDEQTLLIYGVLSGFVLLNPQEAQKSLNLLINTYGGVLVCINVLATLEGSQKIKTGGVWLNLRKYLHQLEDQNESEIVIGKVREIADWEVDDRSVLRSSFTELLEQREILTESLHGCLEFDIEVLDSGWIKQILRDYLERYANNELFTPAAPAYISYKQQLVTITNLLDMATYPKTVSRFLLPDNVRFIESLYSLADRKKISVVGLDNLDRSAADPMFGLTVDIKKKNLRQLDTSHVRVEANSYDPASGILNIMGQSVKIIRQPNKFGKRNESKQAQLMRLLFSVNTFSQPLPIRKIYPVIGDTYPQETKKKATALVAEMNRKIGKESGVYDLISCDEWRFEITPHYLKN